ncbi:PfkB family carbohydrate kinase [Pseudomonas gingeri]|uniref:Sugar kinase n=1 Tax=Pseudomonas gingeri TaxID=117681 RepID=A0A7Y8CIM7_9PSED|nr:PfkB family carbohydrate kinase [Pseudomonas gingeri]NVZ99929.1 sugar kinase [Pseudomonas gingeri]NWA16769.1 sugar kinase [Pseudomonas gingeri]NWA53845.1 sugar kinase [Pseudomonas gingeri]NWA94077.1 sugar kinase [Pseudomonas gingeri]NWB02023.1 sugar kinase [Pseudomonas gingeri]
MARLLHTGQVMVDLVISLDQLPVSGGDALANTASFEAGAGFNVMAAARRNGLAVVYLGRHGNGRFGELARQAMVAEGVEIALDRDQEKDTGLCVSLTEASAERTFISHIGAEGGLSSAELARVAVQVDDYVYVSGYSLQYPDKVQALLDWVLALPRAVTVVFDPGPLVNAPDSAPMAALLPRIDIWTSNSVESLRFTGAEDIAGSLDSLAQRLSDGALLLVRDGPGGCWISRGGERRHIPGFKVRAVDTNGAGDAHSGVFLAGLAAGLDAAEAALRANAAAALAVTRWGPATSPGTDEVDALLARPKG